MILHTIDVEVYSSGKPVKATILLDSGSDISYVTSDLVHKVKPKFVRSDPLPYAVFGETKSSQVEPRNMYQLKLGGSGKEVELQATEIANICVPLHHPKVP